MPRKPMAASRLRSLLRVEPGSKVRLANFDPGATHGWTKEKAQPAIAADLTRMADLQERLFAERQQRVLVILQGIDAAGKDGTITPRAVGHEPARRARRRISASRRRRSSPTTTCGGSTRPCPAQGRGRHLQSLALRGRAHRPRPRARAQGDVVAPLRPDQRLRAVLSEEGMTIVKFFLVHRPGRAAAAPPGAHDDPTKRWKVNVGDLEERARWDDYIAAFEEALTRCSTTSRRGTSSRPTGSGSATWRSARSWRTSSKS